MAHKFRVYIQDDKEYFEYGSEDYSFRKEFPFGETLINFIYFDMVAVEGECKELDTVLPRLQKERHPDDYGKALAMLGEMSKQHPYFELLYEKWADKMEVALEKNFTETDMVLPVDELQELSSKVQQLQKQIKDLFGHVLDIDSGREPLSQKMTQYYRKYTTMPEEIFTFKTLQTRFEMVQHKDFVDVLYPEDIYDLIGFFVKEFVRREQRIRACKNCGRYFVLRGRSNAEYCDRLMENGKHTCKDMGAITVWTKKKEDDEIFKIYRREYKKRFSWIKAGKIDKEDFYLWSEQAREQKKRCEQGEIIREIFIEWLKNS